MAITRYSTFDKTVNTIAERNAIVNKVNHMTVVVKDAIADPSAGAGKAIYRWDAVDNEWILVSKSSYETISFITEEIMIVNGEVQLSNFPVNNSVWNAVVLSGQLIYAELNTSAVSIANSKITGINSDFNGKTLRVTYAYGSIAVQITSAIEDSVDAALLNNVKTINGVEILGTGNIVVEGVLPELKTVNSQNIVGSGNIEVNFSDVVNKPTTISGYGITDAYTKTEVESKIVQLSPPTDISMKADITYVDSKISDIINLAPATLDTFGEIAAKLTEDEGVVATLTSIVGTKANSSDVYTKTQIDSSLNNKVDKVDGKQLSSEDYTLAEKTKLAGIAVNANNYSLPIASSTVLGGVKAGTNISIDANGVISANDTSIAWSEITSKPTTLSGYGITDSIQSTLVSGTNIKTINGTSVLGSGDISTIQTTITGNAGTATKLQTERTINGVSFDGTANISVNTNNSEIIKFDSGTTEGTDLYTFNGSSTKTIDIKAGTNVTLTKTAGSITISANDTSIAWSEITSKPTTLSGYGITDSIQSTLVSGTNIKTINGTSVLGSGDISISGGATLSDDTSTNSTYYPTFAIATTGNMITAKVSSTKLTFNPSTGTLAATEINSLSDVNKKENITNITNGLEIINKLNGVEFDWKENGNHSSGVIAQELEKVLPFLVTEIEGTKTVNYLGIIGYLINAVQELSKK